MHPASAVSHKMFPLTSYVTWCICQNYKPASPRCYYLDSAPDSMHSSHQHAFPRQDPCQEPTLHSAIVFLNKLLWPLQYHDCDLNFWKAQSSKVVYSH